MIKLIIGAIAVAFIVIVGFLVIDPEIQVNDNNVAEVADDSTNCFWAKKYIITNGSMVIVEAAIS